MASIKSRSRINAMAFTKILDSKSNNSNISSENVIITGCEDGTIGIWDCQTGKMIVRFKSGHPTRVKDLDTLVIEKDNSSLFVTISSDGGIKVWDLSNVLAELLSDLPSDTTTTASSNIPELPSATPIGSFEATCRLTCVLLEGPLPIRKRKQPSSASASIIQSLQDIDSEDSETEPLEGLLSSSSAPSNKKPKVSVTFGEDDSLDIPPSSTNVKASNSNSETKNVKKHSANRVKSKVPSFKGKSNGNDQKSFKNKKYNK